MIWIPLPTPLRAALAVVLLGVCLLSEAAGAVREFTSVKGQQMRAEVLAVNAAAKTVTLVRLPDRMQFTVSWDLFSVEDQAYLATWGKQEAEKPPVQVPRKVRLRGVPMVVQHGNFCVPASAAMIAQYHGLRVDQYLIATLSSAGSIGNAGTYPADMALAMEKLGFQTQTENWHLQKGEKEAFERDILPIIREGIATQGPVYVSYRAGVFGDGGHGCVIIGYDDGKKQFDLHNPWGRKFRENYDDFLWKARGIVRVEPLKNLPAASAEFIDSVQGKITGLPASMEHLWVWLQASGLTTRFTYCSRKDERESRRFAEQTARREGRLILDLAFVRSSAVVLPQSDAQGALVGLFIVTEPDSGARFTCRYFDGKDWHPPQLLNLGDLNKAWATQILPSNNNGAPAWDLPMIELVE